MIRNILALIPLFLLPLHANSSMVAHFQHALNKTDALIINLSNLQRSETQRQPSLCEKQGKRMALLLATSTQIYPQAIPYASGCWHHKSGNIYIEAKTIADGIDVRKTYSASNFQTTEEFTKWSDYNLNSKPAEKQPTKEELEERSIIAHSYSTQLDEFSGNVHAMLTDTKTPDCIESGSRRAIVLGYLESTRKAVKLEGCWHMEGQKIIFLGSITINSEKQISQASWKTENFNKTDRFVSWQ